MFQQSRLHRGIYRYTVRDLEEAYKNSGPVLSEEHQQASVHSSGSISHSFNTFLSILSSTSIDRISSFSIMHSSNVHKLAAVASLLAASNALSSNSHLEARDAEPIRPQVKDGFMRVGNGIKNVGGAFMGGLGQGLSGRDVEAILAAREADAEFEELYSIYARDAEPEDFGYYESVYARNADPSFKSWIKGAAPKIEKTVGKRTSTILRTLRVDID